jgi:hypothetical protein
VNTHLNTQEIARTLQRFIYGDQRPRVPIKVVADFAGVSRPTIYKAANGEIDSATTRKRLSHFLGLWLDGKLKIYRKGQQWQVERITNPTPVCPMEALYCAGVVEHRGDRCPKFWSECPHHQKA